MSEETKTNVTTRDALRSAVLDQGNQFKTKEVEVNGQKYLLRQPSVGERKKLYDVATDENGKFDAMEFVIWAVINHTLKPDTKEYVFEDTDYSLLMGLPTGSAIDTFFEEIMDIFNVETAESEEKKSKS